MKKNISTGTKIYFGVIFVIWAVAAYFAWQTWTFFRGAVRTDGVVISFDSWNSGPNKWHNTPTFSFTDQKGQEVVVQSKIDISSHEAPVGSQVPVVYHPDEPQDAMIAFVWPLWHRAIIPFALGFLLAVPGIVVWLKKRGIIN